MGGVGGGRCGPGDAVRHAADPPQIGLHLVDHDPHPLEGRVQRVRDHPRHVFDLADRISVMLHGKLVGTVNKSDVTIDEVLAMIIIGKLPADVTQVELAQLHA